MSRLTFLSIVPASGVPSEWVDASSGSAISIGLKTDTNGTLNIQFSPDRNNVDSTISYEVENGIREPHVLKITNAFVRIIFTYSQAPSYFRCEILGGDFSQLTSSLNFTIQSDADASIVRPTDFSRLTKW